MPKTLAARTLPEIVAAEARCQSSVWLIVRKPELHHLSRAELNSVTLTNLRRGVSYRYLVPDDPDCTPLSAELIQGLGEDASRCLVKVVHPAQMGLLLPVCLFDPRTRHESGFFRHVKGSSYLWLPLSGDRLQEAIDGFEYLWSLDDSVRRFAPPRPRPLVPSFLEPDLSEAARCRALGLHRAAVFVAARALELLLRRYVVNTLGMPVDELGLGRLIGIVRDARKDLSVDRELQVLANIVNEYRIDAVHRSTTGSSPDETTSAIVFGAVDRVLTAIGPHLRSD